MKHLAVLLAIILVISSFTLAEPNGVTILSNTTESPTPRAAASITTAGGTFTTLLLNATTQTMTWKAYVGNVTGSLSLDDASNYTIYDWDLTTIQGEVYASRFNNLTWTSVSCATPQVIASEGTFNDMTAEESDRLNQTFNWTIHKQFQVATTTIPQNTCNSTVTYVNDTRPVPTTTSPFQEILIMDANNQLVYLTSIDDNSFGYNNNGSTTNTFDFQMIVAESDLKGSPTTYYFYVELG